MWPKRKIQLIASSAAPGIDGVRAVLKEIQLEFLEIDPAREKFTSEFTETWLEKPIDHGFTESGPATELVFWSEGTEYEYWRERAIAQGLRQQSIQSFIHTILHDEILIRIPEPTVFIQERPLLGHVLDEAGFEPTILWPQADGKWLCVRKQGLHWVIPESWMVGLEEESSLGRKATRVDNKATWRVRDNGVDFYQGQEGQKFVGYLPRWPVLKDEEVAAQNIAQCIDLGVSWLDIRLALSSSFNNIIKTDNLRWNNDDFRWNARACGEKLPAAPIDYVEDWWAR
ncbi:hypothetical protein [Desulfosporosinus sp. Sb-LF]|uniref:hypothetical protein n=1 Tax=Desulfosporosinus sp. Sb-LF TaxID=2560027 RepID=UPI001FB055B3|nr:hypothetical protein [Desulfosporosinus sp. Sb-LF]